MSKENRVQFKRRTHFPWL